METVIRLENVSFSYNGHPALENVNLEIHRNDFTGVIGPNGGGKTTLLRLILGLTRPAAGTVKILGTTPERARAQIGYVPQYANMDKSFPILVKDVVAMGLIHSSAFLPWFGKQEEKLAEEALRAVDIADLADRTFGELSGGQQQRCLIARAIVQKPKILLLDEPTASVDSTAERDIYELLHSFNADMTILLVSHDLGFVSSYINKVVCINRTLVSHLTGDISFEKLMHDAYKTDMTMLQHKCKL